MLNAKSGLDQTSKLVLQEHLAVLIIFDEKHLLSPDYSDPPDSPDLPESSDSHNTQEVNQLNQLQSVAFKHFTKPPVAMF